MPKPVVSKKLSPRSATSRALNPAPKVYLYVRFSSVKQQDGTSLVRQKRLAKELAAEHGIEIEEEMFDKAMSGFTGANRLRGELGKFLARVANQEIARGSILIVENQDRLSRETPRIVLVMLEQFREAGIRVLTADRRELTSDDETDELLTFVDGQRSRRESNRKSQLITDAIIAKCEAWTAGTYDLKKSGQIGAGANPLWIDWDKEAREYRLNDKADAVKKVLELYRAGYGAVLIAEHLEAAGLSLFGSRSRNTTGSMTRLIRLVLTMPALTGTRVLGVGRQRGRQKDASKVRHFELENYYPAIIKPVEFKTLTQLREH
jgi:DNA invertase Pin-like site-specific DNA recombinase